MNHGKTVFAQLLSMMPEYEFDKCVVIYVIDQSLYSFSQICGITHFEKVPLNELFSKFSTSVPVDDSPNLFINNHF